MRIKREKSSHTLKQLHGKDKIQYLWDYYKLPFLIICIVIYILFYCIYGQLMKKTTILSIAFVNVNISSSLSETLTNDFLSYENLSDKKYEIYTYDNLLVQKDPSSENLEYTYASSTKLLAAINNQKLDLVFMNQEAMEQFSQNGYLLNLSDLTDYTDVSISSESGSFYGINASAFPILKSAGFDGDVYLGIIANSSHIDECIHYLQFLENKKS